MQHLASISLSPRLGRPPLAHTDEVGREHFNRTAQPGEGVKVGHRGAVRRKQDVRLCREGRLRGWKTRRQGGRQTRKGWGQAHPEWATGMPPRRSSETPADPGAAEEFRYEIPNPPEMGQTFSKAFPHCSNIEPCFRKTCGKPVKQTGENSSHLATEWHISCQRILTPKKQTPQGFGLANNNNNTPHIEAPTGGVRALKIMIPVIL